MDLRSGTPYFLIRNGLPYLYPKLGTNLDCDVLVVGSGITGALCAHACTLAGAHTVVIDSRAIGTGSTSASTALLQYEIDAPLHQLAHAVGEEVAVRSYRLCSVAVEELLLLARDLGVDAQPRESLQFASRRGHVSAIRKEHALRIKHGFQVDLLEEKDVEALLGFRKPGALLSKVGAEIDPYAFTHALLQDVVRRGGQVFERTALQEYVREGSGFTTCMADGKKVRSHHVIMATGYESQAYLPKPVLELNSTYAVASERIAHNEFWHRDCLIWETDHPYLYLRTTPDRRIIIGGVDEPFRDPQRRDKLLGRKTKKLVLAFKQLFPHLPFQPEYAWCGTFGSTKEGLPFIDQDERTGAWFVLGMGGNGITFSQIGAHIVRSAIEGKTHSAASLFKFGR